MPHRHNEKAPPGWGPSGALFLPITDPREVTHDEALLL